MDDDRHKHFNDHVEKLVKQQLLINQEYCRSLAGKEDLYKVWKETSSISVEIFGETLMESGACKRYCCTWKKAVNM